MKDYINGCYTKNGSRPLHLLEIKYKVQLSNGMWCVIGEIPEDGISADVYSDKELKDLIFMEHGYKVFNGSGTLSKKYDFERIVELVEIRLEEMGLLEEGAANGR